MNPLLPKDFPALLWKTVDAMSDKKKTGLIISYRTAVFALLAWTALSTSWMTRSVAALQRLPDLIETIDRHTKELEANKKAIESIQEVLHRNKLGLSDPLHSDTATVVFTK